MRGTSQNAEAGLDSCKWQRVLLFCYPKLAFYEVFRKSENAIRWAINLASLSYESIVCSQMSVSEIGLKAAATTFVLM